MKFIFLPIITLLVYLPAIMGGFIWDDDAFLTANPLIQASNGLYYFWFSTLAPDYFPLTSTTLWLEWRLWGGWPLGYHLVNVLLHAGTSVIIWRILCFLKIPGAWGAALFFSIHPVNVESVAWITQRKNTLALFFYMSSLLFYLPTLVSSRKLKWHYWMALLCFGLALLSKSASVMLPAVMLVLLWWKDNFHKKALIRIIPFGALAVFFSLVTIWFQYKRISDHTIVRTDDFYARLAGAVRAVWFYLGKALYPVKLNFVYASKTIESGLFPILMFIFISVLTVILIRYRALLMTWLCYCLTLLPVLGFLNIYFMRYALVADHWQYFALPGLLAFCCALGTHLFRNYQTTGRAIAVIIAVLLCLGTWQRCRVFSSSENLWQDVLSKNPHALLAHNNLGLELNDQGRSQEAASHLRMAIQIAPQDTLYYNNLGVILTGQGKYQEALEILEQALKINPDNPNTYYNISKVLTLCGKLGLAIDNLYEALRISPRSDNSRGAWLVHKTLGELWLLQGSHTRAEYHFKLAGKSAQNFF